MQVAIKHNPDYIDRAIFPQLLREGQIEFAELSLLQRMLLMTDGTLTKMLETYTQEHMNVVKLLEVEMQLDQEIGEMWANVGRSAIRRHILLQGHTTKRNWMYAESIIIPDRLDEQFRYRLRASRIPIGRLWHEQKLETFKEGLRFSREAAGDLAFHFDLSRTDTLLSRTYLVYTNRKPTMQITEKFPERFFA